jgi:hypothetical protein
MTKHTKTNRRCNCELCRLSRCLQQIAAKCTPGEKACLEVLWDRMERAETAHSLSEAELIDAAETWMRQRRAEGFEPDKARYCAKLGLLVDFIKDSAITKENRMPNNVEQPTPAEWLVGDTIEWEN